MVTDSWLVKRKEVSHVRGAPGSWRTLVASGSVGSRLEAPPPLQPPRMWDVEGRGDFPTTVTGVVLLVVGR